MISKKYRLTEKQTKKVLQKGKPFFSYGIVLNFSKNKLNYNRFAVVIGGKSVKSNVERNFFRRFFYNKISQTEFLSVGYDYVFVVKKQTKLDKNDKKSIFSLENDINFLINKIK